MKNLRIRTKLLVTFMIIVILFCGSVSIAVMGLQKNEEKYSNFYNVGYQITNKVMSMRRGLQIIIKNLTFITIEDEQSQKDTYAENLNDEVQMLTENIKWLSENFTGDKELIETFENDANDAIEMQETVMRIAKSNKIQAQEMLMSQYQPLVDKAVNELIEISAVAEKDAEEDYTSTITMQKMLVALQLGIAGFVLVITVILSAYLTRGITKPLYELEKSAGKIVSGDLAIDVKYKSKDELGSLADAFRDMALILKDVISDASRLLGEMADGNFDVRTEAEQRYVGDFQGLLSSIKKLNKGLSSTLFQINQSADQVAAGSSQVANGAQALSQGATEQASAVEELAATITGISLQVKNTAENATQARGKSTMAGDEAEKCNEQMIDMMAAMEEITRTSNEIGKIIKTIEDISFQTNILALNAAVEASRAGVAGKGFAVVADEVRNLAGKSSEASKNTAELIESSMKAVTRGTQIADSTAESLRKVVEEVRMASEEVVKIADAAEEQASNIEQVTLGVDQISTVVQSNSDTAVQSAATSEELSSQAEVLKGLVARFILRRD